MKASRKRPEGTRRRLFGLIFCGAILTPSGIGYQDLAALIARQPAVTERWRQHVRNSAFGAIHAATFSFPRPMGSAIPDPYFTRLASLDPRALDITGSVPLHAPIEPAIAAPKYDFPVVERRMKGDKLTVPQAPAVPAAKPPATPARVKDQASLVDESKPVVSEPPPASAASPSQPPAPESPAARKGDRSAVAATVAQDAALGHAAAASLQGAEAVRNSAVQARQSPAGEPPPQPVAAAAPSLAPSTEIADVESGRADLNGPLAPAVRETAPAVAVPVAEAAPSANSAPKAEERVVAEVAAPQTRANAAEAVEMLEQLASARQTSRVFFGTHEIGFGRGGLQPWEPDEVPTVLAAPHVDPEIKRAALDPLPDAVTETPGETVAPKGEVTGEGQRPRTPAERLNLSGAARVKHEKCLANAIYFEARGEVERGQMAVAQVILNRAFSGYYPGNVCDVVYQNAHRHLACQFTFACDNVRDVVRDAKAWSIATRIAGEALDGKFWLPEIGKATHYHATYVNPWWVRTMTKHSKLGIHIFYRPKRWGPGEEIPVWGDRLDITGSVKSTNKPEPENTPAGKRAEAQPPTRRSIFDPVEEIGPGG